MSEKQKILKIKVGEVFINNKAYPVFQTAFKQKSKDGKTTYYNIRQPIFIQEIELKDKVTEGIVADVNILFVDIQ